MPVETFIATGNRKVVSYFTKPAIIFSACFAAIDSTLLLPGRIQWQLLQELQATTR